MKVNASLNSCIIACATTVKDPFDTHSCPSDEQTAIDMTQDFLRRAVVTEVYTTQDSHSA